MRRLSLIFAGFLMVGLVQAGEPPVGKFRLRVPEEAARVAKLSGKAVPTSRLILQPDNRFDLINDGAVRHGRYRAIDGKLFLTTDDGTELHGDSNGDRVTLEGLDFEREVAADLKGLWTVRRNGLEEKGLRMDLKPDGKFRFSMAGATSEGSWSLVEGKLVLVWSKIDDESVEPGTVRKEIPVAEDGASFKIDTYRYERATA